jgi:hypothetical protein
LPKLREKPIYKVRASVVQLRIESDDTVAAPRLTRANVAQAQITLADLVRMQPQYLTQISEPNFVPSITLFVEFDKYEAFPHEVRLLFKWFDGKRLTMGKYISVDKRVSLIRVSGVYNVRGGFWQCMREFPSSIRDIANDQKVETLNLTDGRTKFPLVSLFLLLIHTSTRFHHYCARLSPSFCGSRLRSACA